MSWHTAKSRIREAARAPASRTVVAVTAAAVAVATALGVPQEVAEACARVVSILFGS